MCARTMMDSYYTLMRAPGITEDTSELERKVWDWYAENRDAVLDCKKEHFERVLAAVNRERFDGGVITGEEFIGWLKSHERGEMIGNTDE